MHSAVRVRVPAKVNLHLHVLPPRPDGFHPLETIFQAVSLVDHLAATPASGLSLRITGRSEGVPTDERNLAWRAAVLLAALAGTAPDVHLEIHKLIPVAGGMAGGSADAAAALLACARLWGISTDLRTPAGDLGSDVAFPLIGGTAVGTGRGEVLTPIDSPPLHWLFVPTDYGISAGAAYRELDRMRAAGTAPAPTGPPQPLIDALAERDIDRIGRLLVNDLQPAVLSLAPTLVDTLRAGVEAGAVAGIVSGSGPTCAFLCRSAEHAGKLAARLGGVVATGPVPGAAVV